MSSPWYPASSPGQLRAPPAPPCALHGQHPLPPQPRQALVGLRVAWASWGLLPMLVPLVSREQLEAALTLTQALGQQPESRHHTLFG